MMWDYYGHGAGTEGWLTLMFMIVFAVAVVIAIVFFVRYFQHPQAAQEQAAAGFSAPQRQATTGFGAPMPPAAPAAVPPEPHGETPRDIVMRRYAAGEIDREEYLQKLADL